MVEKKVKSEKVDKIKLTQLKSAIGRNFSQRQTLIGLGLNKLHKVSLLEDTKSIRGMINKVKHLIKVEAE